ncbi:MAG: nucleotide-binding protein [Actinomycetota bacterium]|nr:nucleotide-binding protein [Actinomycetota bacterium]
MERALDVPRALYRNAGNPLPALDMATALDRSPGSSGFRQVTAASNQYGLTAGSYRTNFTMQEGARRIIEPTTPDEREQALVDAALTPPLFRAVFDYYKGKKFPERQFFINALVREFDVPASQAEKFAEVFTDTMRFVGLIRETPGGEWLASSATPGGAPSEAPPVEDEEEAVEATLLPDAVEPGEAEPPALVEAERKQRPNRMFVGHGKNKKPLDQLKGLLDQLGIPYSVAETQPNLGRPIPTKVRETMEECGAGILIFSADEEYFDKDGNSVWKNSENVAKLGAAAVMYDDRVIIFKEDSVRLASNYNSIGYIEFEKDKLDAKMPELLKELVAMKILKSAVNE